MISFGLPNETIETDPIFGQVLVSVDEPTSVVTFIWCNQYQKYNLPVLYTVLSTCYDGKVFNNLRRSQWISTIISKLYSRYGDTNHLIRRDEVEPFVVQALAFDAIERLKGKTHDNQPQSTPAT